MARLTPERAKELHDWCMADPEYAAKWRALASALSGTLCDIPADALETDEPTTEQTNGDGK